MQRHLHCRADSNIAWSEHDPTMNSSSRTGPFSEATFRALEMHFILEITTFRAPATYPMCLPQKVTLQNHQMLRLPRKMTLQHHQVLRLPRKVTLQHHQMLRLLRWKTLQHHHEKWHSNFTKYCTCHKNWLCVTWLSRYLTELLLYWAVTLLTCYFTELLLYWAVTLLNSLHF